MIVCGICDVFGHCIPSLLLLPLPSTQIWWERAQEVLIADTRVSLRWVLDTFCHSSMGFSSGKDPWEWLTLRCVLVIAVGGFRLWEASQVLPMRARNVGRTWSNGDVLPCS